MSEAVAEVFSVPDPQTLRVWIPSQSRQAELKAWRTKDSCGRTFPNFEDGWYGRRLTVEITERSFRKPILECGDAVPFCFPRCVGGGMIDAANVYWNAHDLRINPGAAFFAAALALRLVGRAPQFVGDGFLTQYAQHTPSIGWAMSLVRCLPNGGALNLSSGHKLEADQLLLEQASEDPQSVVISLDKFRRAHDGSSWRERFPLPFERNQLLQFILAPEQITIPGLGAEAQAPILDFFRAFDAGEFHT